MWHIRSRSSGYEVIVFDGTVVERFRTRWEAIRKLDELFDAELVHPYNETKKGRFQ